MGDSITHDVGGAGFEQNGEPIVEGVFRNKDGYCWAKLFKEHFDALVDNEDDIIICTKRLFHMNDINDLYLKTSLECGFPFISMYLQFLEYCDLKGITVDSLLADGLHPNDNGHYVMFKLILKELGIEKNISDIKLFDI